MRRLMARPTHHHDSQSHHWRCPPSKYNTGHRRGQDATSLSAAPNTDGMSHGDKLGQYRRDSPAPHRRRRRRRTDISALLSVGGHAGRY